MTARYRIGEGEVVLHASVQGLASEAERVRAALDEEKPAVVALGLSAEAVASLLRYQPDPEIDPFEELPDHDLVYSVKLGEFGEVDLPPPDLVAALAWAKEHGATCYGVDLSEEAYEDLFTKSVSAFGFLRYGRIQRKLAKKPPKAATAREFSLAWDARIRREKGIARVEAAREEMMARAAAKLARDRQAKVLLLVDAPQEAGVSKHLAHARE
jgi:hypothetical protein